MKKNKIIVNFIFIILVCVVIVACYFGYNYFSKKDNSETNLQSPQNQDKFENLFFTEETYPVVDGSTATIPLAEKFEEVLTGSEDVEITHSKTHEAYEKLVDGEADLILVVEPSDDDKKYAEEKNVELRYDKICNEGFVFFVNKNNPVDSLTLEQIQKIYSGEITNWKEVGGNDEEIKAFQRPENSGSQTGMENLVMKDKTLMEAPTENIYSGMEEIIDAVSAYDNGSNAIGYSYYYYANTMYISDDVKLIKVDGVMPDNETIRNEEYSILTAYYSVTREDETRENVINLRDFMLSASGKKVIDEAGYVSVK